MSVVQHTNISISQIHNLKRIWKFLIAIIVLTFGGLIYVVFRSEELLMFDWFNTLELNGVVVKLREEYGHNNLWEWVNYNMPAGLWLFSYMFIIDSIWEDNNNPIYKCFIVILPVFAITSELLQFINILPGTFDIWDVISYVFAILLFIIIKSTNK